MAKKKIGTHLDVQSITNMHAAVCSLQWMRQLEGEHPDSAVMQAMQSQIGSYVALAFEHAIKSLMQGLAPDGADSETEGIHDVRKLWRRLPDDNTRKEIEVAAKECARVHLNSADMPYETNWDAFPSSFEWVLDKHPILGVGDYQQEQKYNLKFKDTFYPRTHLFSLMSGGLSMYKDGMTGRGVVASYWKAIMDAARASRYPSDHEELVHDGACVAAMTEQVFSLLFVPVKEIKLNINFRREARVESST